ncbi:MAG: Dabb family protein [Hydrogenoanaerobacterium sp.]
MVKHIVFWNLKDEAEGHKKSENAAMMKEKLEGLVGKVPGLLSAFVGVNFTEGGYDLCLYSELSDKNALAVYQGHPEHLKVKEFVHKVTCARAACDSEAL